MIVPRAGSSMRALQGSGQRPRQRRLKNVMEHIDSQRVTAPRTSTSRVPRRSRTSSPDDAVKERCGVESHVTQLLFSTTNLQELVSGRGSTNIESSSNALYTAHANGTNTPANGRMVLYTGASNIDQDRGPYDSRYSSSSNQNQASAYQSQGSHASTIGIMKAARDRNPKALQKSPKDVSTQESAVSVDEKHTMTARTAEWARIPSEESAHTPSWSRMPSDDSALTPRLEPTDVESTFKGRKLQL